MFRSHLPKLSVTLVLLVATAFVSVTAVAADPWYPVNAGDAALYTLDNPNGHWIGPETVSAALGQSSALPTLDNPNGRWIGPETVSAALSLLDNPNGRWIGPETVSAALGQLQP